LKLRAPAKLNLRLSVLSRSDDGYHSIETLFLRLGLADEITITTNVDGIRLDTSGLGQVPGGTGNLCWQAAELFFRTIGSPPTVSIGLVKHIPVAAGLGGGSSDAAAILLGLNRVHGHPLDQIQLMNLAAQIGSDVSFFVTESQFALGLGRGERLLSLEPPPSRPVLIVVPNFGVSAGDAYAWLAADVAGVHTPDRLLEQTSDTREFADWDVLAGYAQNDLAEPVYQRYPALRAAADSLTVTGAAISLLCGSGACVAGIYQTTIQRDAALEELRLDPSIPPAWRLVPTWSEGSGSPDVTG